MKKMFKMMVVMMMVVAAVLTAGCGEEEKYNKLKGEVNGVVNQIWAVGTDFQLTPGSNSFYSPEHLQHLQKDKADLDKLVPEYETKVKELEKIAIKDAKLNKDFTESKEDWDAKVKVRVEGTNSDLKSIAEHKNKKKTGDWDGTFEGLEKLAK